MAKWVRENTPHQNGSLKLLHNKEDFTSSFVKSLRKELQSVTEELIVTKTKLQSHMEDVTMSSLVNSLHKELQSVTEELIVTKAKLQSQEEELNCVRKQLTDISYKFIWCDDAKLKDELEKYKNGNRKKSLEIAEKSEEIKSLREEVDQSQRTIFQLERTSSEQKKYLQRIQNMNASCYKLTFAYETKAALLEKMQHGEEERHSKEKELLLKETRFQAKLILLALPFQIPESVIHAVDNSRHDSVAKILEYVRDVIFIQATGTMAASDKCNSKLLTRQNPLQLWKF